MLARIISTLISCICLAFLVFTDLDTTQRLLLTGVVLFDALESWLSWRANKA